MRFCRLMFPIIFAHRGASLLAPENTCAAFTLAYELGARAIECDVQCTADFIPVIIHDETLDRTTNGHGFVAAKTAEEMEQLSAGAWFDPRFVQERVPRLIDLLSTFIPLGVTLNLEIKPNQLGVEKLVATVLEVLAASQCPKEQILLSSFDRSVIELLASKPPGSVPEYALLLKSHQPDAIAFAQTHRCVSINPHISLLKNEIHFLQQAHAAELKVFSFTLNEPSIIQNFLAAGLDGFFTDDSLCYSLYPTNFTINEE